MLRLLLDTSTTSLVVALADGASLVAQRRDDERRAQAVLDIVHELLVEAGATLADIDSIAVGVGPGGFTGVRVGIATARGLAIARDLSLAPLSTLAAIAQPLASTMTGTRVWAISSAQRAECFLRPYQQVNGIAGFSMVAEGALRVVASDEVAGMVGDEPSVEGPPTAEALLAVSELAPYGDPRDVLPVYGREPDAVPTLEREALAAAAAATAGGGAQS